MDAFLISFGIIFVAELGDKSQLMALAMAAKHRARDVFIGMFFAILIMFAIACFRGSSIPLGVVRVIVGDMVTEGILFSHRTPARGDSGRPDLRLLERVLDGIQAL